VITNVGPIAQLKKASKFKKNFFCDRLTLYGVEQNQQGDRCPGMTSQGIVLSMFLVREYL